MERGRGGGREEAERAKECVRDSTALQSGGWYADVKSGQREGTNQRKRYDMKREREREEREEKREEGKRSRYV